MNWDLTKEEMHRKRFRRVSNVNLLCHRMYLLSRHICVPHQPGCHLSLGEQSRGFIKVLLQKHDQLAA